MLERTGGCVWLIAVELGKKPEMAVQCGVNLPRCSLQWLFVSETNFILGLASCQPAWNGFSVS